MLNVKWQRISLRVNIIVSPFLIDWNGIAPRFFEMIHDALSDDIAVNPGDFSVSVSNNLADVVARYDIFGATSNVSLHSDRLTMEFPTLVPEDEQLVLRILEKVVTAFPQAFPGHRYSRVHASLFRHGAVPKDVAVAEYLARHGNSVTDRAFGEMEAAYQPAVRFSVRATAGTWRATCTLEQSEILPNGLFMDLDVIFPSVDESAGFQDWVKSFLVVADGCMGALELER